MLEKLVGAIRAQQYTIEVLTVKFEEANAKLKKANARIAELEEQLHKNSHNSSKPPSYDDCEKSAPKSQRKMSGKKACSQTICKGHHMMLGAPDRIEPVYPQHRLRIYKGEVCRFADNPIVPFANSHAERDLRMIKMKSKVIGTFRSEQGAYDFLV